MAGLYSRGGSLNVRPRDLRCWDDRYRSSPDSPDPQRGSNSDAVKKEVALLTALASLLSIVAIILNRKGLHELTDILLAVVATIHLIAIIAIWGRWR